ncbi:MAG TPA: FHA domain-containing protein [Kofleriaceae bacterium]|nr:FHA domain-containing protein [Kofleriaceae bacterium]
MDVGLVCDSCSAFSPMGAQRCLRCGESLSLDRGTSKGVPPTRAPGGSDERATAKSAPFMPPPRHEAAAPNLQKANIACPTCGTLLPVGHKFCFNCGARMPDLGIGTQPISSGEPELGPGESFDDPTSIKASPKPTSQKSKPHRSTMFFGAAQVSRAKLTLIRGDGLDGVSFTLAGDEHQAGRGDVPLAFPEDPFLSPVHANFFYREGRLIVRDENAINGVYLRIHGGTDIQYGSRFLVGEQVLEVQRPGGQEDDGVDLDEPIEDGTYFFASPRRPSNLRIVQHLRGGDTGLAHRALSDAVTIGREGNDIDFPDDPFISGHHARVTWTSGKLVLTDLSSRNGTFIRIAGERSLEHGDYVFMGQQLLRVEIV